MVSYEKDRKRIAYGFSSMTMLVVAYLTVFNTEALSPVLVGIISLFLVCTLALLGVENPVRQREGEKNESYMDRLAKGGDERKEDTRSNYSDEDQTPTRSDRSVIRVLWFNNLSSNRTYGCI